MTGPDDITAEPLSNDDEQVCSMRGMAPATTFTASAWGQPSMRWFVTSKYPGLQPTLVSQDGGRAGEDNIDTSTIRDVVPPPITPGS